MGGAVGADALTIYGDMRLNDHDLFLRPGGDLNHGLGWYGEGKLFGSIGLLCFVVSFLSGSATAWMKLSGGVDMTGNPLLLLTVMSLMMGVQFLFFGMLGELCSRIYFAAQNQTNYTVRRTWNFEEQAVSINASARRAA